MVLVLLALVAAALVVAVLAVAGGRLPVDALAEPVSSTPDHGLPQEPDSGDVARVRFDTALRGYRRADVHARLDDLARTLAAREHEVAELRGPQG